MIGMGDKHKKGQCVDTLIGPGVVIRGDLRFSGGCYIEGTVHGKVIAEDGSKALLTIAEHGHVEGEVHAPVVVVSGRMTGDIHASERIELTAHARVQGNIHYTVVEMAAGARISGRLVHADTPLSQLTERSEGVAAQRPNERSEGVAAQRPTEPRAGEREASARPAAVSSLRAAGDSASN